MAAALLTRASRLASAFSLHRRALHSSGAARERIAVGISGGVDSAVAALLLQRQGHKLLGVFMRYCEEGEE